MQSGVYFSLAALLALPAIGCAQSGAAQSQKHASEVRPAQQDESEAAAPRRLESVTWNSVNHELTWMISSGAKTAAVASYQISLDDATMTFGGETRRFSTDEASNVHVLMDLIAKYAVDSTAWWEDGSGEPVHGNQPQEQSHPEKSLEPGDSDGVPDLRVAVQTAAPADLQAVRLQIRRLERKLAELRRIERSAAAAELVRD